MDCAYGKVWMADHWARHRDLAKLLVTMQMEGTLQTTIVDSGCSQTLVQANLVGPPGPAGKSIYMQCIHKEIQPSPMARSS